LTVRAVIARSAWEALSAELDRVAPAEGIALPLVALRSAVPPWRSRGLSAIDALIVPRVLRVPAALQENSALRVSVLPSTDAAMQRDVAAHVARHPRLRVAAYLHSHPFAHGSTWPSSGDYHGHMLPLLAQNRASGVDTAFSLIACRARAGWALQCFALDGERVVDCGLMEAVGDEDEAIRFALSGPLDKPARAMLRQLCRRERRAGRDVRSTDLFDGYRRYVVREGGAAREVIFVPCDFPRAPLQRFTISGGSP
jgi:hypothetical protein